MSHNREKVEKLVLQMEQEDGVESVLNMLGFLSSIMLVHATQGIDCHMVEKSAKSFIAHYTSKVNDSAFNEYKRQTKTKKIKKSEE